MDSVLHADRHSVAFVIWMLAWVWYARRLIRKFLNLNGNIPMLYPENWMTLNICHKIMFCTGIGKTLTKKACQWHAFFRLPESDIHYPST